MENKTIKLTFTQHDVLKYVLTQRTVAEGTKPIGAYNRLLELGFISSNHYANGYFYSITDAGSEYLSAYRNKTI